MSASRPVSCGQELFRQPRHLGSPRVGPVWFLKLDLKGASARSLGEHLWYHRAYQLTRSARASCILLLPIVSIESRMSRVNNGQRVLIVQSRSHVCALVEDPRETSISWRKQAGHRVAVLSAGRTNTASYRLRHVPGTVVSRSQLGLPACSPQRN